MKTPASWHGDMWREGMPTGNGLIGTLTYGGVYHEKILVIDDRGLFTEADARVFAEFGGMVSEAFSRPIAELTQAELAAAESKHEYVLQLPQGSSPRYLVMMEDIEEYGERVQKQYDKMYDAYIAIKYRQ